MTKGLRGGGAGYLSSTEVLVQGLRSPPLPWQFLSAAQSSLGPESSSPFPSVPVSVPVSGPSSGLSGPHLLSKKGALQPRASQRHRGSVKGQGPLPPDSPQHVSGSTHPCRVRGPVEGWKQCGGSGALGEQKKWKQEDRAS